MEDMTDRRKPKPKGGAIKMTTKSRRQKLANAARMTTTPEAPVAEGRPILFSDDVNHKISERAFELFEKRGRMDGFDQEDWIKAEKQIRKEFLVI